MPHGSLTPLGTQLRAVLATLRNGSSLPSARSLAYTSNAAYHIQAPHRAPAVATSPAHDVDDENFADSNQGNGRPKHRNIRDISQRQRVKRRPRRDWIAEALKETANTAVAPAIWRGKIDLSHASTRKRNFGYDYYVNRKRHQADSIPNVADVEELSLERIVASYILHVDQGTEQTFTLNRAEAYYVQQQGYNVEDIVAWATTILARNPTNAATMWKRRMNRRVEPVFVAQHLLRRPVLTRQALQILIDRIPLYMEHWTLEQLDTAFIFFIRLTRHARSILPQAIDGITEMFFQYLARIEPTRDRPHLPRLTYTLNKAMTLVSLPTAVQPFKDIVYGEAAVVQILKYMADHDPPLQLNREGYRAVIRMQLGQELLPNERKWAELKALSWPPWKVERTNMDSLITPETGVSRAGNTLARMGEAGYSQTDWERAAKLFSGWDTDGTPTIQTRTRRHLRAKSLGESAVWMARIVATRTIQESWAAFLAFHDAKLPLTPHLALAILEKLHQEANLQHRQRQVRDSPPDPSNVRLLPGEARENSPLPPSTHLETYTRTPPPTLDEFMEWLHENNFQHDAHTLAFATTHAATLEKGISYLLAAQSKWPAIGPMVALEPIEGGKDVPNAILFGFINLLCRQHRGMKTEGHLNSQKQEPTAYSLLSEPERHRLSTTNPLVQAVALLLQSNPTSMRPWTAVLTALSRVGPRCLLRCLVRTPRRSTAWRKPDSVIFSTNSLAASQLAKMVHEGMQRKHAELDAGGFIAMCQVNANTTCASYRLVRHSLHGADEGGAESPDQYFLPNADPWTVLRNANRLADIKQAFHDLVGDKVDQYSSTPRDQHDSRNLLFVPGPSVLHAYIRTLGFMGAYDDLLHLVRWMSHHHAALAARRARDRAGEHMMRRALVALRVFLERAWLAAPNRNTSAEDLAQAATAASTDARKAESLGLLRALDTPAPAAVVAEARRVVESVEGWGGWPEDGDEVARYYAESQFGWLWDDSSTGYRSVVLRAERVRS